MLKIEITSETVKLYFDCKGESYKIEHNINDSNYPKLASFVNETLENNDEEPLSADMENYLNDIEEQAMLIMAELAYEDLK